MSVSVITYRMMAMRKGAEKNNMVEVSYRQGRDGTKLETLIQDLYLCASMEFLLTVVDTFLKALDQGFTSQPKNNNNKPSPTSSRDAGTLMS